MQESEFAVPATAQRKGPHILVELTINERLFTFLIKEEEFMTLEYRKGERVGRLAITDT